MKRNKFLMLCIAPFLIPYKVSLPKKSLNIKALTNEQISDILFKTLEKGITVFKQLGYGVKSATISIGRFNAAIQESNIEKSIKP